MLFQVLINVGGITPRTQWLIHYSFTGQHHRGLGVKMRGAVNTGGEAGDFKIISDLMSINTL